MPKLRSDEITTVGRSRISGVLESAHIGPFVKFSGILQGGCETQPLMQIIWTDNQMNYNKNKVRNIQDITS